MRERMLDLAARDLGHRPRRDPPPQHHRPRRAARGRCSPVRRSTCACRPAPRSSARSRSPTSTSGPHVRPRRGAEGRCLGVGLRHLHRGGAGPARLPGVDHGRRWRRAPGRRARSLGARGRRHRLGVHPADAARPGSRDHAGPGRGRRARGADRAGATPLRRHRHHAVRALGHRRQPLGAHGGRRGHLLVAGAARAGARRRRRPARGAARRPRDRRRRHPRGRRAVDLGVVRRRRRRPPRRDAAQRLRVRRRRGRLGPGHARVLGRGRPRRPGRVHIDRYVAVEDCGELDQPQRRRRPGQRRGGAGHRRGALRAVGLRRAGQLPGRHVHGLPAARPRRRCPRSRSTTWRRRPTSRSTTAVSARAG